MLRNIRLGTKFGILAILAMALIAIPTTLYILATNKAVAHKRKEISAIAVERQMFLALQAIQKHRGASGLVLSAQDGATTVLDESAKQTEAAQQQIAAMLPALDAPAQILDQWKAVAERWRSLRDSVKQRSIQPRESFDAHTKLVAQLLEANGAVVDAFGLSLDNDAASFRLAMITLVNVPALTEELGKTRAIGARILAQGEATAADVVRMTNLVERSAERAAAIRADLEKMAHENPEIGDKLGTAFAEAQRSSAGALETVEQRITKASPIDMPGNAYFEVLTRAIDANFKMASGSIDALETLLEDQSAKLRRNQLGMLAALALLIAASIALAVAIVRSVTGPIAAAVEFSGRVAQGDLSTRINARGSDECAQLMRALNEMSGNLATLVTDISSGTDAIHAASHQIAAGNMDLSSRTEEQASSLEQTASSMTELTETVKQNAENATQANALTRSARDMTVAGSGAVRAMVKTIEEIHASSSKVAEITGMIEGIAFQTNILALNAAVEAARAGEQGKGFAVVAGEVRSLAQRAAAAAKEIKDLIMASSASVRQGARQAEDVEAAMAQLDHAIGQVSDIVSEISSASQEQSAGIEQVHQAISQIDTVTQQNAALVEESASAAHSLEEQAGKMQQAMTFFRIDR
ncbi:methyl-accepting chemotaxis protein [Cupriavidus numazuensis]|uniref:Methyl-accepting chemotaxis protein n=1 Tax=Cupriavidus numazuensis TaxID=221992 RepID=A0ABM8TV90_9BURK|nr:methyl-accepting chemotaxis protein [Cupriavidus numazuensis]CAG2160490.1 hypothetical protein LMG26411_07519 [Cupriavidus numazuensis]